MERLTTRYSITHIKTVVEHSVPAQRDKDNLLQQQELEGSLQNLRAERDNLVQASIALEKELERQLEKLKIQGSRAPPILQPQVPGSTQSTPPPSDTSPAEEPPQDDLPPTSIATPNHQRAEVHTDNTEPVADSGPQVAKKSTESSSPKPSQAGQAESPAESPMDDADLETQGAGKPTENPSPTLSQDRQAEAPTKSLLETANLETEGDGKPRESPSPTPSQDRQAEATTKSPMETGDLETEGDRKPTERPSPTPSQDSQAEVPTESLMETADLETEGDGKPTEGPSPAPSQDRHAEVPTESPMETADLETEGDGKPTEGPSPEPSQVGQAAPTEATDLGPKGAEKAHKSPPPLSGPPPHMVKVLVKRFNTLEKSVNDEMQNIDSQQVVLKEKVAVLKDSEEVPLSTSKKPQN